MKKLEITFNGRKPNVPSFFGIGMEDDRYVVELHVVPPKVVDNQVTVMHLTFSDDSIDVVDVPRSGIVSINDNMTRVPGNVTAWLEVMNSAGEEVWHSYTWNMYVGSLVDSLYEMDQMDPTILRRMAAAIQAAEDLEEKRQESFEKLSLTATRVEDGVLVEATNIDGTTTSAIVYDGAGTDGEGSGGGSGEDGGFYMPQVTQDGYLVWIPSKDGMPDVATVNIKGKDGTSPTVATEQIEGGVRLLIQDISGVQTIDIFNGQNGTTPIKGVDYFTDEEIAEIAAEAAALIESGPVVAGILIGDKEATVNENDQLVIPIAGEELGVVRTSSAVNGVTILPDGTMQINSIDFSKLTTSGDDELILNSGGAN